MNRLERSVVQDGAQIGIGARERLGSSGPRVVEQHAATNHAPGGGHAGSGSPWRSAVARDGSEQGFRAGHVARIEVRRGRLICAIGYEPRLRRRRIERRGEDERLQFVTAVVEDRLLPGRPLAYSRALRAVPGDADLEGLRCRDECIVSAIDVVLITLGAVGIEPVGLRVPSPWRP
jgi:hypothetical protein